MEEIIKKLSKPLYRKIYKMHYLEKIKLKEIAVILNYSIAYIYRVHSKAMKEYKNIK